MTIGGALISAAGSLLGGVFGDKAYKPSENVISHARGLRKASELYGFNPLTLLGGVSATAYPGYTNPMGAAIAEAAMIAGDALAKRNDKIEAQKLQAENERLQQKLTRMTLQPKVGGVYAQRAMVPTIGQSVARGSQGGIVARPSGDPSADPASSGVPPSSVDPAPDGVRPLLERDDGRAEADPRREVQNTQVVSDAGYALVDNPATGRPFPVPAFNGEILDPGQAAMLAGSRFADTVRQSWLLRALRDGDERVKRTHNRLWAEVSQKARRQARLPYALRFDPNHRDGYYAYSWAPP